jgi:hypothetical protein
MALINYKQVGPSDAGREVLALSERIRCESEGACGTKALTSLASLESVRQAEPTVLRLNAPMKIFGDLHGQFADLMRLFDEYGSPSTSGDISYIDYLFLGDYVDRGSHSLEIIVLLLALKVENPYQVLHHQPPLGETEVKPDKA